MTDETYPPTPASVGPAARAGIDYHLWRLAHEHPHLEALRRHVEGLPDDDPELLTIARHHDLFVDTWQGGRHRPRRALNLAVEYQPGERVDALLVTPMGATARTVTAWATAAAEELEQGGEAPWAPTF